MGSIVAFLGATVVMIIGWAARLESKVNVQKALQEQKHEDLKELINTKFDAIVQRLTRIENSLNGNLKAH